MLPSATKAFTAGSRSAHLCAQKRFVLSDSARHHSQLKDFKPSIRAEYALFRIYTYLIAHPSSSNQNSLLALTLHNLVRKHSFQLETRYQLSQDDLCQ